MPILMGKSGRLATNASVASSIASSASRATTYFGRLSPGAGSFIEPDVSTRIATAAPRPSSTSAWYGAGSVASAPAADSEWDEGWDDWQAGESGRAPARTRAMPTDLDHCESGN